MKFQYFEPFYQSVIENPVHTCFVGVVSFVENISFNEAYTLIRSIVPEDEQFRNTQGVGIHDDSIEKVADVLWNAEFEYIEDENGKDITLGQLDVEGTVIVACNHPTEKLYHITVVEDNVLYDVYEDYLDWIVEYIIKV